MKRSRYIMLFTSLLLLMAFGCATKTASSIPVDMNSATPGGTVTLRGKPLTLTGIPLQVGNPLPPTALIEAGTMQKVDLTTMKGKVLVLSIVPSLDTKVCEAQTHTLGEIGARLPVNVEKITISRDTPFAQKRFAEESKLAGITYLSDYRDGSFGRSTGLLQEESMLLARALVLVDKEGIVRYIQVVPELSHFPDMETVIVKATALAAGK